jgi:hypothetical protein
MFYMAAHPEGHGVQPLAHTGRVVTVMSITVHDIPGHTEPLKANGFGSDQIHAAGGFIEATQPSSRPTNGHQRGHELG